ncbi:hypothetical protein MKOR_21250 [Mycolicibacillus koreensis]|nr:hypothetical protein MKOR_21250 [Mycolicibacillus koreensis]
MSASIGATSSHTDWESMNGCSSRTGSPEPRWIGARVITVTTLGHTGGTAKIAGAMAAVSVSIHYRRGPVACDNAARKATAVQEAGVNPARSRHCHRGAILIGHGPSVGWKARGAMIREPGY